MTRKRVYTRPVGKDSERFPAISMRFKGADQDIYFKLVKIAESPAYQMSQTALARLVLSDWIRSYPLGTVTLEKERQMVLRLKAGAERKPIKAGNAGGKPKKKAEKKPG